MYKIGSKITGEVRVLKISLTYAKIPERDPEIVYLTKLRSVPEVVTLYEPVTIQNINNTSVLLEILEYSKNGDLDKFIDSNPNYFNDEAKLILFSLDLVKGLKKIHAE